jgi:hypothetical protein
MPTIRVDGARVSSNVLARAVATSGLDAPSVVRAARAFDDGNRYLNRGEVARGVDALAAKPAYERLLHLDPAAFQTAARAELAAKGIPQLAALRFGGKPTGAQPGPLGVERDRRMDLVAAELTRALQGAGFTVVREGDGQLLAGRLPEKWRTAPNQGGAWGEAYAVLDLQIPGVGKSTVALLYKREMNEWSDASGAHAYVQPKAEIMLGFVDEQTRAFHGSGYHYGDGVFTAGDDAALAVAATSLAGEMTASLLDFQRLNDRRRPRRGSPRG